MNRIERFFYNLVRFHPRLKTKIVSIYQYFFSLLPQTNVEIIYSIQVHEGYFFGFHDKCPWSKDNSKHLAHQFNNPLTMPHKNEKINIGYFNSENSHTFYPIAQTKTWNWQMGSMLQWLGNSSNIIFNDYDEKKHVAKIISSKGVRISILGRPISAVSSDGHLALSHSFIRLRNVARAYSYANGDEQEAAVPISKEDGLYLIDINSGIITRLFSLADIVEIDPVPSMKKSYHYFTHCLFSPKSTRFIFFHRWVTPNSQTWTRMFSCDKNGSGLHLFNTSGVVTHITWKDDQHILAYAYIKDVGDHYYLFRDLTDDYQIIGKNTFLSDGHPQYSPNRKKIITDTYPDRYRNQRLIIYDIIKDEHFEIITLRSPWAYRGDIRCDFHPRWDRQGTMISFDAVIHGKRSLCIIPYSE